MRRTIEFGNEPVTFKSHVNLPFTVKNSSSNECERETTIEYASPCQKYSVAERINTGACRRTNESTLLIFNKFGTT